MLITIMPKILARSIQLIIYLNIIVNSAKLHWQYTSNYKIGKIIKSPKSKNTSGYHKISNRNIKLISPFIVSPLTHICNAALSSAVFPDRLKYAIAKPIFKEGSKQDISNYRPISLLTSFSKVLEKFIYNRLYTHFETNSILVQEQFGFRMQHSTEQAAFSLINCILMAMNNNTDQQSKTSVEELSFMAISWVLNTNMILRIVV